MSDLHRLVLEFHEKFGAAIGDTSLTHNSLRADLIREEFGEAAEAAANALLSGDLGPIAKELADAAIVVQSAAITLGIDLDTAIYLVHNSNMTKVGYDGKPIIRADGKIMKGPDYRPPDMTPALPRSRQSQPEPAQAGVWQPPPEVSPAGLAILTGWPHVVDSIPDRDGETSKLVRDGLMTKDGELTDAGRFVVQFVAAIGHTAAEDHRED